MKGKKKKKGEEGERIDTMPKLINDGTLCHPDQIDSHL